MRFLLKECWLETLQAYHMTQRADLLYAALENRTWVGDRAGRGSRPLWGVPLCQ